MSEETNRAGAFLMFLHEDPDYQGAAAEVMVALAHVVKIEPRYAEVGKDGKLYLAKPRGAEERRALVRHFRVYDVLGNVYESSRGTHATRALLDQLWASTPSFDEPPPGNTSATDQGSTAALSTPNQLDELVGAMAVRVAPVAAAATLEHFAEAVEASRVETASTEMEKGAQTAIRVIAAEARRVAEALRSQIQ